MTDLILIESKIEYEFKNTDLLMLALTHSSYVNEHSVNESNERLEFLGDSVLGLIVAQKLYEIYPNEDEGVLSKMKSHIVKEESLYKFALKLGLNMYILLGKSEIQSGGNNKSSILSDAFEALLAAIYLDSDFYNAQAWLLGVIDKDEFTSAKEHFDDYKTKLQELIQKNGVCEISYRLLNESGPGHNKCFEVGVYVNGKQLAVASAGSKKSAEQAAAYKAINSMR